MYLTPQDYATITTKDPVEATEPRCKYASQLLDARIGAHPRNSEGWKLNLSALLPHQVEAVKTWCAWLVAYLADNNDKAPSASSISLGRFSVTKSGTQHIIPEELSFADSVLIDSGLVNRRVRLS